MKDGSPLYSPLRDDMFCMTVVGSLLGLLISCLMILSGSLSSLVSGVSRLTSDHVSLMFGTAVFGILFEVLYLLSMLMPLRRSPFTRFTNAIMLSGNIALAGVFVLAAATIFPNAGEGIFPHFRAFAIVSVSILVLTWVLSYLPTFGREAFRRLGGIRA